MVMFLLSHIKKPFLLHCSKSIKRHCESTEKFTTYNDCGLVSDRQFNSEPFLTFYSPIKTFDKSNIFQ